MKDIKYTHKQIREFHKLGLSDEQIEYHRVDETLLSILKYNCERLSQDTHHTIITDNKHIYLQARTRFIMLNVSLEDVICNYSSALEQINYLITIHFGSI